MSMTENPKIEETREAGEDLLGSKFEIANRSRLEGTCSFLDYAKEDDLDTHLLSTHPLYKYAFRVKWTGFLLTVIGVGKTISFIILMCLSDVNFKHPIHYFQFITDLIYGPFYIITGMYSACNSMKLNLNAAKDCFIVFLSFAVSLAFVCGAVYVWTLAVDVYAGYLRFTLLTVYLVLCLLTTAFAFYFHQKYYSAFKSMGF